MRKHPARRTRAGVAVAAVVSTLGLSTAYALGDTTSTSTTTTDADNDTASSSSNDTTYADDYDDDVRSSSPSSNAMSVAPSARAPDTASRAS